MRVCMHACTTGRSYGYYLPRYLGMYIPVGRKRFFYACPRLHELGTQQYGHIAPFCESNAYSSSSMVNAKKTLPLPPPTNHHPSIYVVYVCTVLIVYRRSFFQCSSLSLFLKKKDKKNEQRKPIYDHNGERNGILNHLCIVPISPAGANCISLILGKKKTRHGRTRDTVRGITRSPHVQYIYRKGGKEGQNTPWNRMPSTWFASPSMDKYCTIPYILHSKQVLSHHRWDETLAGLEPMVCILPSGISPPRGLKSKLKGNTNPPLPPPDTNHGIRNQ